MKYKISYNWLVVAIVFLSIGCTSNKRSYEITPERRAEIEAEKSRISAISEKPILLPRSVEGIVVVPSVRSQNYVSSMDLLILSLRERNYNVLPRAGIEQIIQENAFQESSLSSGTIRKIRERIPGADAIFIFSGDVSLCSYQCSPFSYRIIDLRDNSILYADHSAKKVSCANLSDEEKKFYNCRFTDFDDGRMYFGLVERIPYNYYLK